uniref:NADH-ubiquinone oxidoreductase chain 2 n=1 Tax=Conocephalus maculatus TaxID=578476 RepID=A0A0A0VFT2_9ORTH|nr:NADH dehydrogenase subunit 2 [Conocephalus maculatus]AIW64920.1 NADH dehydrogenase subunit 2 [Conocephalus maculatus]
MFLNPSKLLFILCLILGTLISVCSNSWFGVWMGLEINLLSFIPLMSNQKNILNSEASLKYFLIQAFASSTLLFSIITSFIMSNMSFQFNYDPIYSLLINSALLLKMGAAPFHFWFPGTMEGLNWMNCLILMTWQKIAPLVLLSYVIEMNEFIYFIIILSIVIGSLGGLNQTSLRKLMAYSSINHLGWMIAGLTIGENLWIIYFCIYTFLTSSIVLLFHNFNVYHINQNFLMLSSHPTTKFFLFISFLSLGGLPPFLGFFPKWIVIQSMVETLNISLITIMVISTLITLFFYMRLTFSSFLLAYSELKWNNLSAMNSTSYTLMTILAAISSLGLMLSTLIYEMI